MTDRFACPVGVAEGASDEHETTTIYVLCGQCGHTASSGFVCDTCGHEAINEPAAWLVIHGGGNCLGFVEQASA